MGDFNPFADPEIAKAEAAKNIPQESILPFPSIPASSHLHNSPFSYSEYNPVLTQEPVKSSPLIQDTKVNDNRYQELERKAAQLQEKERQLNQQMGSSRPINNWPPIPWCHKCFYHNIAADIPLDFQWTMKLVYFSWIAYLFILFFNVISCLAVFSINSQTQNNSISFGLSIVIFVFFPPISFITWYRSVYKAFRVDSSLSFFFFFFTFGFQILITIVMALGIPGGATSGWINGFVVISASQPVGIMTICCALMLSMLVGLQFYVLFKVHRHYRTMGATAYRAKDELASMGRAGKSEIIRGLVA